MLGLGWPQWLTIIALIGALLLTFKIMARAAVSYEKARRRREAGAAVTEAQIREGEER